jgi:hypothetical protein
LNPVNGEVASWIAHRVSLVVLVVYEHSS